MRPALVPLPPSPPCASFASNNITFNGILPLVAAFPMLGSLEKLWVGPNPLTDQGLNVIANGVASCGSLSALQYAAMLGGCTRHRARRSCLNSRLQRVRCRCAERVAP